MASIAKEFHRLMRKIDKLTDGQASIHDIDSVEGNLHKFNVIIRPNSGLYKNGTFKFQITLLMDYPDTPPVVYCHTDVYHPNIDPTAGWYDDRATNVCINLFEQRFWDKAFGLEGTLLSLLFLMHNPNIQDPVSPYFEGYEDVELFEENVRKYMAGELCEDTLFDTDFRVKDGELIEDFKPVEPNDVEIDTASPVEKEEEPSFDGGSLDAKAENASSSENTRLLTLVDAKQQCENDIYKSNIGGGNVEVYCGCVCLQKNNNSIVTEEKCAPNKKTTTVVSYLEDMTFETNNEKIGTCSFDSTRKECMCGSSNISTNELVNHSSNFDIQKTSNTFVKCEKSSDKPEKSTVSAKTLDLINNSVTGEFSNCKNVDEQNDGGIEIVNIDGNGYLLVHQSIHNVEQESVAKTASVLETVIRTLGMSYTFIYSWIHHCYMSVAFRTQRLALAARYYLNWSWR